MISCRLSTILGAKRLKVSDVCRATGVARATLDRYYYDRVNSFDREVLGKLCQFPGQAGRPAGAGGSGRSLRRAGSGRQGGIVTERELKRLLDARALKQVQVRYAVMSQGYMIVADGKALETGKWETREFKTLDAAAKLLFKSGIADFGVRLKTSWAKHFASA